MKLLIWESYINGYLANARNIVVSPQKQPLSTRPIMSFGSMPRDGKHLALNRSELDELLTFDGAASKFVKKYVGSAEFINDIERYCLWIEDSEASEASKNPIIMDRLEKVAQFRRNSTAKSTVDYVNYPHRFRQRAYKPSNSIIVPGVSSERREYVPIGFLGPDTVISNAAFAIYDAEPWLFALLTSRMHMAWLRSVGGKMKTDFRYSNTLVYNTFPVPDLSPSDKEALTEAALRVLDVREYHCDSTPAELYDAEKMPENLRVAHKQVDDLVDKLYSATPFDDDDARLSTLFAMYEEAIEAEKATAPIKQNRIRKK